MSRDLTHQALSLIESFDEQQLAAMAESLAIDAKQSATASRESLRQYVTATAPGVLAEPLDERAMRERLKQISPRQLATIAELFGLGVGNEPAAKLANNLANYFLPPVDALPRSQSRVDDGTKLETTR